MKTSSKLTDRNEHPKNICRICGKKTKQIFNIEFKMAYICRSCEKEIVIQNAYKS
jgi:hypothetical protein